MSIMKRVRTMTVATLNDMLEKSEDPVRLIDQYLYATRDEIVQADKLHQQISAHTQTLGQQYMNAEQLKEKREQQALLAVKAGEDIAARLALQEKLMHEERSNQYRQLYEQSKQSLVELEEQLEQLKSDYQSVYEKRQLYIARMESLRLQQRMNERMGTMNGFNDPSRMFDRLNERVADMELETRTLRDLRRIGTEFAYQAGTTLQSTLERELQNLKHKLAQEGRTPE